MTASDAATECRFDFQLYATRADGGDGIVCTLLQSELGYEVPGSYGNDHTDEGKLYQFSFPETRGIGHIKVETGAFPNSPVSPANDGTAGLNDGPLSSTISSQISVAVRACM